MSSLERSATTTFGAPFASKISANFFAAAAVFPWIDAYAIRIPLSSGSYLLHVSYNPI